MAKKGSSSQESGTTAKKSPVCCRECLHASLIRYGCNPLLAECHQKPQPGDTRFPYQVEVANAMRFCPQYKYDESEKTVEQRERAA